MGTDWARRQADRLLGELGCRSPIHGGADHPALSWRRSGLMEVSGLPEGPSRMCPAPLGAAADGALLALKALVAEPDRLPCCGALLLGERARLMGLHRRGRISANGSCRLVEAADGRFALNLARAEDWDLVPMILGREEASDWDAIERIATCLPAQAIVERGIEFGLAIALDQAPAPKATLFEPTGSPGSGETRPPLVVDLSALWAGPLAASLLAMAGASVVKVESVQRPDGARQGNKLFYDLLNGNKQSVGLNFSDPEGLEKLRALLRRADIIIEGSRPRALRRLGIERDEHVARGAVWLSITAHGGGAMADRVGFGDDAAVAAGVTTLMDRAWGTPMFAGDAICDPLTGIYGALGAWAAWRSGGGALIELSLSGTVSHAIGLGIADADTLRDWQARAEADAEPLYPLRRPTAPAPALGADNALVLASC